MNEFEMNKCTHKLAHKNIYKMPKSLSFSRVRSDTAKEVCQLLLATSGCVVLDRLTQSSPMLLLLLLSEPSLGSTDVLDSEGGASSSFPETSSSSLHLELSLATIATALGDSSAGGVWPDRPSLDCALVMPERSRKKKKKKKKKKIEGSRGIE